MVKIDEYGYRFEENWRWNGGKCEQGDRRRVERQEEGRMRVWRRGYREGRKRK